MASPKETKHEIKEDMKRYAALSAVAKSEGGEILIDACRSEMASAIEWLCANFRTASDIELRASIARVNEKLSLFRTLTRAEVNLKDAKQVLKDVMNDPENL